MALNVPLDTFCSDINDRFSLLSHVTRLCGQTNILNEKVEFWAIKIF